MCSFLVWKNACLNYREFDLEGDLVRVPRTWYLSAQSLIRLLKLLWREYDIVAMNEWKKKCVGLQRTWVSERTVYTVVAWTANDNCWHKLVKMRIYFHTRTLATESPMTKISLRLSTQVTNYSKHFYAERQLSQKNVGVTNCPGYPNYANKWKKKLRAE